MNSTAVFVLPHYFFSYTRFDQVNSHLRRQHCSLCITATQSVSLLVVASILKWSRHMKIIYLWGSAVVVGQLSDSVGPPQRRIWPRRKAQNRISSATEIFDSVVVLKYVRKLTINPIAGQVHYSLPQLASQSLWRRLAIDRNVWTKRSSGIH